MQEFLLLAMAAGIWRRTIYSYMGRIYEREYEAFSAFFITEDAWEEDGGIFYDAVLGIKDFFV